MTQVLPVIKKRRSYRSYHNRPIEKEKIQTVLEAAMYAPSAMHKRGWEFIVVTDQDKIQQLSEMKPGAEFVAEAPAVIVIASQDWRRWLEDASITAAHIYLEAEHQNLGTCWVNVQDSKTHQDEDAEAYVRQALDINQDKRILCLMPLGYPAEEKEAHSLGEFEQDKVKWIEQLK